MAFIDVATHKILGQAPERAGVLVDHCHGVAALFEGAGQLAADPAAPDDHHVHLGTPAFEDVVPATADDASAS